MKILSNFLLCIGLFTVISFTSCGDDDEPVVLPATVVDIALSDTNFSSLVAALQRADLVSALQAEGPFTVFAPTNAAFADLLTALNVETIDDIPLEILTNVLLYHVVSGKVLSTDLSNTSVGTLNPDASIAINIDNGVVLNGASNVTSADLEADNGVVHVIDAVLLP